MCLSSFKYKKELLLRSIAVRIDGRARKVKTPRIWHASHPPALPPRVRTQIKPQLQPAPPPLSSPPLLLCSYRRTEGQLLGLRPTRPLVSSFLYLCRKTLVRTSTTARCVLCADESSGRRLHQSSSTTSTSLCVSVSVCLSVSPSLTDCNNHHHQSSSTTSVAAAAVVRHE